MFPWKCFSSTKWVKKQGNKKRELVNLICSHVPMEIFLFYKMGKEARKSKESCYVEEEVLVLMHSPEVRVRNDFRFMPLGVPPSEEHTCIGTSPTT
jgi:hypothetical protein